eukprot:Gb_31242 [translate_table: standard]
MDSKDYIDMPSVTQSLLGDLAKMRELLDKFEVSKEAKEVYRKEKQPRKTCLNTPKIDFSRLEYIFKEIEIRHTHNNEEKIEEEKPEYEESQGRDTQEEITEDQTPKPMANEQEVDTLNKAIAVQGKIYDKERPVEESPQQEIMDDEINELYMGTKNIDSRHPKGHLEGHAYSPYDEVPIEGKEHFNNKPSNKADKEQRKDMEWNNKHLHAADALKTMAQ